MNIKPSVKHVKGTANVSESLSNPDEFMIVILKDGLDPGPL